MGRQPFLPDLSVHISRRTLRCVPDPLLCLSRDGAAFICGLTAYAEVWLVSEFLNILDNSIHYMRRPEDLTKAMGEHLDPEEVRDALRIWHRHRDEGGSIGGPHYWVRDALRESRLPVGMDESVLWRWESMAETLDGRLSSALETRGTGLAPWHEVASRDAAALSAVLHDSILLCSRDPKARELSPMLCGHLEAWRLPCRRLEIWDDMVSLERGFLLQLLVESGLAGFVWGGLRLAVVHFIVPGNFRTRAGPGEASMDDDVDYLGQEEPQVTKGAWDDARAFWYDLNAEQVHAGS